MEWSQKALKRGSLDLKSTVMMMLKIRLVTMRMVVVAMTMMAVLTNNDGGGSCGKL